MNNYIDMIKLNMYFRFIIFIVIIIISNTHLTSHANQQTTNPAYNLKFYDESRMRNMIPNFNKEPESYPDFVKLDTFPKIADKFDGFYQNCSAMSWETFRSQRAKISEIVNNGMSKMGADYCKYVYENLPDSITRKFVLRYKNVQECMSVILQTYDIMRNVMNVATTHCQKEIFDTEKKQKALEEQRLITKRKLEIESFEKKINTTIGAVFIEKRSALIGLGDSNGKKLRNIIIQMHNAWYDSLNNWASFSALTNQGASPDLVVHYGKASSTSRAAAINFAKQFNDAWADLSDEYVGSFMPEGGGSANIIVDNKYKNENFIVTVLLDEFGSITQILGSPYGGYGNSHKLFTPQYIRKERSKSNPSGKQSIIDDMRDAEFN